LLSILLLFVQLTSAVSNIAENIVADNILAFM